MSIPPDKQVEKKGRSHECSQYGDGKHMRRHHHPGCGVRREQQKPAHKAGSREQEALEVRVQAVAAAVPVLRDAVAAAISVTLR